MFTLTHLHVSCMSIVVVHLALSSTCLSHFMSNIVQLSGFVVNNTNERTNIYIHISNVEYDFNFLQKHLLHTDSGGILYIGKGNDETESNDPKYKSASRANNIKPEAKREIYLKKKNKFTLWQLTNKCNNNG